MRTIGMWSNSKSIRITKECDALGIKDGDGVNVYVDEDKIVIQKIKGDFKTSNGVKFMIKE